MVVILTLIGLVGALLTVTGFFSLVSAAAHGGNVIQEIDAVVTLGFGLLVTATGWGLGGIIRRMERFGRRLTAPPAKSSVPPAERVEPQLQNG